MTPPCHDRNYLHFLQDTQHRPPHKLVQPPPLSNQISTGKKCRHLERKLKIIYQIKTQNKIIKYFTIQKYHCVFINFAIPENNVGSTSLVAVYPARACSDEWRPRRLRGPGGQRGTLDPGWDGNGGRGREQKGGGREGVVGMCCVMEKN